MTIPQEPDLLKRPLYVYDLPPELLESLQPRTEPSAGPEAEANTNPAPLAAAAAAAPSPSPSPAAPGTPSGDGQRGSGSASCGLCGAAFSNAAEQRAHVKSDWHGYNVKQRIRGGRPVDEAAFDRLVDQLDESISGSDSSDQSSSDGEEDGGGAGATAAKLGALLKRQARVQDSASGGRANGDGDDEDAFFGGRKKKRRGAGKPPLLWFSSSLLSRNTSLGVYRALLTPEEQSSQDLVGILKREQLQPEEDKRKKQPQQQQEDEGNGVPLPKGPGPTVLVCMIGGGHFAAMIVSLTPSLITNHKGAKERQAKTLASKTFHRYTTRRKQGGAQSSNDQAKGPANSAGAGIRRANEIALESDIRALLWQWRGMIAECSLLFIRATGTTNRRVLFGDHEQKVLDSRDQRIRSIPFSTRRATQQECMRAFVELTRVKVSQVDEEALRKAAEEREREEQRARDKANASPAPKTKESKALNPEEEEAMVHTSQLQALIRRSKIPAVLSYFSKNSLDPNFRFMPPTSQANHHASTPLHLAASLNSPLLVSALLIKAGADPTATNGEGKPAFDIAGDRATRDMFRVARSELGEAKWPWTKTHIPAPLTKAEAEQRDKDEKAQDARKEAERRKAEIDKLESERPKQAEPVKPAGRSLGGIEVTAADKREQEARGLTPEMRMRLERERRARAAEERVKRMAGR